MPLCLKEHALSCIDQDDRELRIRSARRHIAGVLLVSRGIRHYERTPRCCEETIGNVDRDSLLPLCFKPIDQERKIDVSSRGSVAGGILDQARELVLMDKLRIVQQAADQG